MPVVSQGEIKQYLTLYFGQRVDWFNYYMSNYAKAGATLTQPSFVHKNFLRKVVKLWANNMPSFDVTFNPAALTDGVSKGDNVGKEGGGPDEEDPKVAKFNDWKDDFFARQGWEGNTDFWGALPFFRTLIALGGTLHIKLPVVDGTVKPTRMRTQTALVLGDGKTIKGIRGYKFWYQVQDPQAFSSGTAAGLFVQEEIVMDSAGKVTWTSTTSGANFDELQSKVMAGGQISGDMVDYKIPDDVSFLPVVTISYEPQEDSYMGMPIARHLVDACMDICSVLTDIRKANKKTSGQQLVLMNSSGDSIDLDSALELQDDGIRKADAKYIGGGQNLASLEKELEEHKKDVYETANVPYPGKDDIANAPSKSGKAQIVLSAPQRAEISNYQNIEGQAWAEILWKAWQLEKPESFDIALEELTVEYDAFDSPDPDEKIKRAEFFEVAGYTKQGLREMGLEDDTIERLEQEKAEADAEKLKNAQNSMVDQAAGKKEPVDGLPADPSIPANKDVEPKLPAA